MYKANNLCALVSCALLLALWANAVASAAAKCKLGEFSCGDGSCIAASRKCDGKIDCASRADETYALCFNHDCEGFQCAYGACYKDSQMCDGVKDCWDGSDEFALMCANDTQLNELADKRRGQCSNQQYASFECVKSKACIALSGVCDGKPDCSDGSDESFELCVGNVCPTFAYKCAYGGCIAQTAACNHIQDCWDGSDELLSVCNHLRKTASSVWRIDENKFASLPKPDAYDAVQQKSCAVPQRAASVRLSVLYNGLEYAVGKSLPHLATVQLSCGAKQTLLGAEFNTCNNGNWQGAWPVCERVCSRHDIINDVRYVASCVHDGRLIDCATDALLTDTRVTFSCAAGYKNHSHIITPVSKICSEHATWEKNSKVKLGCIPKCGKAFETQQGWPWSISIYERTQRSEFTYRCGGVIVDPYYALTAANCFPILLPNYRYTLALGEQHAASFNPNLEHPYTLFNVTNIRIMSKTLALIKLVRPFTLSATVKPICLQSVNETNALPVSFNRAAIGVIRTHIKDTLHSLTHISNGTDWLSVENYKRRIRSKLNKHAAAED
ncbi:modular serine protease-like [Drosophila busckii]|uniref:modular serine protease-like n=1 Tax=Drosophila busckii TaxID=30019 RepID=UPI00083E9825|nr:modular serine protease-like [Drosophila busckii]